MSKKTSDFYFKWALRAFFFIMYPVALAIHASGKDVPIEYIGILGIVLGAIIKRGEKNDRS